MIHHHKEEPLPFKEELLPLPPRPYKVWYPFKTSKDSFVYCLSYFTAPSIESAIEHNCIVVLPSCYPFPVSGCVLSSAG